MVGQFLNLRSCLLRNSRYNLRELSEAKKNFIPMDSEKEKESLKRSGETLQGAEKKKQKVLDVEDIPIPELLKVSERREIENHASSSKRVGDSHMARKGMVWHTSTDPKLEEVVISSSKFGMTTAYGPEEDLERRFAESWRIFVCPPYSEDTVWRFTYATFL
ncbi:hypothetical protein Tco_1053906 [Tanacetum coccineum]|uniref:Uncharacterized protein n=1 Tax=Tanacetum coccineum TaxID=301880 RepID=A0ABQ5GW65_9ASTR